MKKKEKICQNDFLRCIKGGKVVYYLRYRVVYSQGVKDADSHKKS